MRYFFDDYTLDLDRRELMRGAEARPVEPQVFDLLAFLIGNRHRVVSKDDLLEAVWAGRIVSESTMATRINAARSAIGDSGEAQRLIRTLPRKGFRFVGAVHEGGVSAVGTMPEAQTTDFMDVVPAPATTELQPLSRVRPDFKASRRAWIFALAGAACAVLVVCVLTFGPQILTHQPVPPPPKFVASAIPLVTEDVRKILAEYPGRPDAKALAISAGNYGMAVGAADPEVAKQEALERCRLVSSRFPNSCRIYSVGTDVVWNKALLPLPAPQDLHIEPLEIALGPSDIPYTNDQARDAVKAYLASAGRKAMAITGRFSFFTQMGLSPAENIRVAMERCGYVHQRPCLILSVDGQLSVQIPRSLSISDTFLPRTAIEFALQDRERIGHVYDGKDWRALARGKNGWYPVADAPSEAAAVNAALTSCSQADTECHIYAISNFQVVEKR